MVGEKEDKRRETKTKAITIVHQVNFNNFTSGCMLIVCLGENAFYCNLLDRNYMWVHVILQFKRGDKH